MVPAGLHRHVERRAAGALAGRLERDDLAVAPAGLGDALADDLVADDDDRADRRLRVRPVLRVRGELERPLETHPPRPLRTVSGVRLESGTVPDSSLARCQTRLWHRL